MKEQKWRLSKSSINFGGNECDWSTTLRPDYAKGSPVPAKQALPRCAGISYNAQQGLYKNGSTVSLGSDAPEYYRANAMPNLQKEHSDWQDYRGKKDEVFAGLIRKSSLKLGSDKWFYTKSTMREMLEESAKHGYAVDVSAIADQRAKNLEIKKALRRSQICLGTDKTTDYFQANALPNYTPQQVIETKQKSALDPKLAKELRKTNYVLGDDRLMEYTSVAHDQFPVMKNDTDFVAIKKKQAELVTQLRSTQFTIGDGSPVVYKKTSEMKNWYLPETYDRPRTPAL
ncbi:hypothetical protein TL16_g01959 [Triparma laevis f. inornata]|uniref:Uncharacterized protein n=2 Tax=Triparma laevis TaxID=1534972 RepID=A0A9W7DUR0_9STRA|nr:hypothetical protein TL16_g01959 [Triparma laevis f. inornata]